MSAQADTASPRSIPAILARRLPGSSRVLAVIEDGSADHPLIHALVNGLADQTTAGVVLLNMQPEPNEVRTRGMFKDKTRAALLARGRKSLSSAEQALTDAGALHSSQVVISDDAEVIVQHARKEGCSLILIAASPISPLRRRWRGLTGLTGRSIAAQLADIADLPMLILPHRGH